MAPVKERPVAPAPGRAGGLPSPAEPVPATVPSVVAAPGQRAWKALGWFWALVVLGTLGTVAVLAWLGGPVVESPRQLVPASPASASPAAVPEASSAPPATSDPAPDEGYRPLRPVPEAALAELTLSELLPAAPEPPPLPGTRASAVPETPIPPPDPALLQDSPAGPLPRIGDDGRQPRHAYARTFDRADTRPRIGLVLLGASDPALRRLPGAIALALAEPAPPLLALARARGMETLLLLPRPQPATLDAALARFTGYVGALVPAGGTDDAVQDSLRQRGLLLLGAVPATRAWGRAADLMLDDAPTRGEIDRQLLRLEQLAHERGSVLGILPAARPLLVERVAAWAATLPQRGLVLAPVTALTRRPTQVNPP